MVVVLLVATSPGSDELAQHEPRTMLPADQPFNESLAFSHAAFPEVTARTRTVLVFKSEPALTAKHEAFLRNLSNRLVQAGPRAGLDGSAASYRPAGEHSWTVHSPYSTPFLRTRLTSADHKAAMIVVNSDTNYLTHRSVGDVTRIDAMVRETLPADLRFEITGEGGLGRDLAATSKRAFDRTTFVTLAALLIILAVIYRAPLAALVPVTAIGVSVVAAIMMLNHLTRLGWAISTFEKTIVVVLLFGSGTDFALFWLASYREQLVGSSSRFEAAAIATRRTGPAIVGSAATTICGLLMLMFADLLPSFNAGRALAVALSVSLVAALTLVPSLALLLRGVLFWPRGRPRPDENLRQGFWGWVGRVVASAPLGAVLVCVVLFAWPTYRATRTQYTYDAFGVLPAGSGAARGEAIAREHFSAEQLFSWTCVVHAAGLVEDFDTAVGRAGAVAKLCLMSPGVIDVWHLGDPLGSTSSTSMAVLARTDLGRRQAATYYYAPETYALRLEIMLADEPMSTAAMTSCAQTIERVDTWARAEFGESARVYATGLTPYILNIKDVADRDHVRVVVLVLLIIFAIVYVVVRDLPLALVMLAGTVLVYLVTIGVTDWFFVVVMGLDGIDWKVKLFTFVILVAVGQDYNIFLVTRLRYERRSYDAREAARRAIAGTGAVISGCGAIMAATLGSLAATGVPFFQQLGMAFAFGVLVDTFVVRPVFVPGAYLLLRGGRAPRGQ